MSAHLISIESRETPWRSLGEQIVVGKDILELLSSSMYIDPMSIYREYVQNAADAIDDAIAQGLLGPAKGRVEIMIDPEARTVSITDNGIGLPYDQFTSRLTAFGGSTKRGTKARGFRGVGRLAGIGYCQELVFRGRAAGELQVSELRWDCRKLKTLLRSTNGADDLMSAVAEVVSIRRMPARALPERFFQVELHGIIRHRNDQLLNTTAVGDYLSQVAPVPFDYAFPFWDAVMEHLAGQVRFGDLHVTINESAPLRRPHRATIALGPTQEDAYSDLELITVPAVDGGTAALGWVAHHGYLGALPSATNVRGLRLRVGNIQVGDDRILEELFPETRFNAWSVGEIHIIDPRVIPNGRRDHFEQNVHYNNVLTHLLPAAREITRRCRTNSVQRKWLRDFELRETATRQKASIFEQSAVTRNDQQRLTEEIRAGLAGLAHIADRGGLPVDTALQLRTRFEKLEREMRRILTATAAPSPLSSLPAPKRRVYEHVIGLIYECSSNQAIAKILVDKILDRLK